MTQPRFGQLHIVHAIQEGVGWGEGVIAKSLIARSLNLSRARIKFTLASITLLRFSIPAPERVAFVAAVFFPALHVQKTRVQLQ